jgi:transcription elongation factor Elf1
MSTLTPEQKKVYLATGGAKCPFCGSDDIESSAGDTDANYTTREVACGACGEEWTDVYTLTDVTTS